MPPSARRGGEFSAEINGRLHVAERGAEIGLALQPMCIHFGCKRDGYRHDQEIPRSTSYAAEGESSGLAPQRHAGGAGAAGGFAGRERLAAEPADFLFRGGTASRSLGWSFGQVEVRPHRAGGSRSA